MNNLINKIKLNKLFLQKSKNDVFKNMAVLASGAVVARLIGFSSTTILTRIYTPEHFGILSVFMAGLALIAPFATLRYSSGIPLLKKDGVAINLFVISMLILFTVTLFITILLICCSSQIFDLLSLNDLMSYWWLLPIAIFGSGIQEILRNWSIRQKDFKTLAKNDVLITITGSALKILLGFLGFRPLGLLVGTVFTSIMGSIYLVMKSFRNIINNIGNIRISRIALLLQHYSEYPKYRLPSQLILALSIQMPVLVLTSAFGTEVVGQYSLAVMVLSLPLSLLGNSTGQAYYGEIAKIGRKNPEKIFQISIDVLKKLLLFSIIPFLVVLFFAPLLFSFVFGEIWYVAGEYASILAIYMLTSFITTPLVNTLSVFEKQLLFLKLNILRVVLLSIVFFISITLNFEPKETVLFYSIVLSLHYLYVSYTIFNVIKYEMRKFNVRK